MANFRSTRDEFMDIEHRWRLVASREARLEKRERDVRLKEEEIRQFMNINPPVTMATPMRMPMHHQPPQPSPPLHQKPARNHRKNRISTNTDKDYAQFAVVPRKDTTGTHESS